MTDKQVNKFLTLFIGKAQISKTEEYQWGESYSKNFGPFSPSGIFEWKEYMENNHSELWNCYCNWCLNIEMEEGLPTLVNCVLNPRNLAEFLLERREEWEWVECPCPPEFKGDVEIKKVCPYCNGTGKIKHPALVWAEKEGL